MNMSAHCSRPWRTSVISSLLRAAPLPCRRPGRTWSGAAMPRAPMGACKVGRGPAPARSGGAADRLAYQTPYCDNTGNTLMPELEIHHESEHAIDPAGQRVGVLAAVLAVVLAIVSIASHRTPTEAIMQKSSANDAWSHSQATRVKFHNLELGESLVGALGAQGRCHRKVGRQVRRAGERLCSARQEDPGRSGAGRPFGRNRRTPRPALRQIG